MKLSITLLAILFVSYSNAQLVVDDFETGNLNNTILDIGKSDPFFQSSSSIIGKTRRIHANVRQNPYGQSLQTAIKDGFLVITAAYEVRGTVYIGYGKDKNDKAAPLNLNLSTYNNLKIKFAAKSTVNGIYVMLFTGTSRASFSKHVPAREGSFVFTIPLLDIKKVGPNYTLNDIDQIRFQFDSRSKTGCNMAIDKIWFE